MNAVGGEAGVAAEGGYGPFFTRASVRGGALRVDDRTLPLRGATVAGWYNAWQLAGGVARGPSYPNVVTTTAVRAENSNTNSVITEESADVTIGGPIASADVAMLRAIHADLGSLAGSSYQIVRAMNFGRQVPDAEALQMLHEIRAELVQLRGQLFTALDRQP